MLLVLEAGLVMHAEPCRLAHEMKENAGLLQDRTAAERIGSINNNNVSMCALYLGEGGVVW
jgi:hypothetical protein